MTKLLRRKVFRSDKTAEWYGILEAFPFYLMNKFDGHVLFVVNQKLEYVCFWVPVYSRTSELFFHLGGRSKSYSV